MLQHLNQVVIYRCLPLNAMANRTLSIYRDVDFGMFEPQKHLASAVQLAKFDRNETDCFGYALIRGRLNLSHLIPEVMR